MPQYSVDDLKTPDGIERVLRQFERQFAPVAIPAAPAVDLKQIAGAVAPLIQSALQAPGSAPLNLTALLPSTGTSVVIEDTHANRIALYPPANSPVGTLFYETDRTVLYTVISSSGTNVWQYVAGMYVAIFANRPTDLGANDRGFLLFVTVQCHVMWWSGTAWFFLDGGGAQIQWFAATPPGSLGWQLCDGTATDYLALSGADLAVTAFTTPDLITAPAGVYFKTIAAYTGAINAATAGAMSGLTAVASTGISIVDHPSHTHDDASSINPPNLFAADVTAAGVAGRTGGPSATLTHPVTDPQHQHLFGTIAVDATGQPRNIGLIPYFRR